MKIKILLAPFLIILTIVIIIWYIYPAYTNGVDGVREESRNLAQQKSLMQKLDSNAGNVNVLEASLTADAVENAIVYTYIPKNKEEEKIIENLNSLAKDSTLSVLNISITQEKRFSATASAEDSSVGISLNPLPGLAPDTSVQAPVVTKVAPNKLQVNFSVVGDYANIRNLLEKIQKLKRFNKLSGLEIKTLLREDQSMSESLQADLTLEFNYLPELMRIADSDVDNVVFTRGKFDNLAISKIKSSRSIEINNVTLGQKGESNPFAVK